MKKRWLLALASAAISGQSATTLSACANDAGTGDGLSDDASTPLPDPVTDGGVVPDADADADATCVDDCEYYPDDCTEDALCSSGLFDVGTPSTGLDLRTHVQALVGRSPNDGWLAGTDGAVAHFDGTSWKRSMTGTQYAFYGLWLLDGVEVTFGDPKQLYTRGLDAGADASADGWSPFAAVTVHSAWGDSHMRVETTWAHPGSSSVFVGATTTGSRGGLWRLRYSRTDNAFALTPVTLNGCTTVPCREVYGLDGLSADELWAVGPKGAAFRVTDAESDSPTLEAFNTLTVDALHSVWAAASNDIWAVGSTGTVRRYRGDAHFWEVYDDLPTKQHLYAIAGSSPSDVWVAGDEGTVFHYDGTAWARVKVAGLGARRPRLHRIWIPSPGKVWIAGQGALLSLGGKP